MRRVTPRTAASNTKVLVIVLICVGVVGLIGVAACCGLGYWGFKTAAKEITASQAAADAFFDKLQAGKLQEAYDSTSGDFKSQQTFVQFSVLVTANPNLTGHTSRTSSGFNLSTVNGVKTATIPYSLSGPTGVTNCTVTLTDTGAGWQVSKLDMPLSALK